MLRVGLTGGMGSGKTTVARIFETLGVPVFYADAAAKKLMNEDPVLKAQISNHFGEESYKDNILDRTYLAAKVFNDPAQLEQLNDLVHPATLADARRWLDTQKTPYAVKEAALLFESGAEKDLDLVVGVSSPLPLRLQRIARRDSLAEAEAMKKMDRQMDEVQKMKRCNFIIYNDEKQMLIPQVLQLHAELLELASQKKG